MKIEFDQLITLVKTLSENKVASFVYETEEETINIKTVADEKVVGNTEVKVIPVPTMAPMAPMPQQIQMPQSFQTTQASVNVQEAPIASNDEVQSQPAGDVREILSPLVGTFYSAASPEDEPFVKVGDKVKKGQKIGIIEAMKLMNDIESEFDGEIVEILVSNENMVEYGQPLFRIK